MADTLADLDLLFAFETLASEKGWPTERNDQDTAYTDPLTQRAWESYEAAHGQHSHHDGQQLFAEIKKSSKYAHQATLAKSQGWPYPFPVTIKPARDGYVVKGGYGGEYRLADVNLYVIEDGQKTRLS